MTQSNSKKGKRYRKKVEDWNLLKISLCHNSQIKKYTSEILIDGEDLN